MRKDSEVNEMLGGGGVVRLPSFLRDSKVDKIHGRDSKVDKIRGWDSKVDKIHGRDSKVGNIYRKGS